MSEPTWTSDDGRVMLYLGDNLTVLPSLASQSVDGVITDPPYNVGLDYASIDDRRADYATWCGAWFAELQRVCAEPIAVSVGQANLSQWATIAPPTWWLAWWKPAAMGRCVVGFNNWEPIALYGKTTKATCDVIRATITPDASISWHPCPKPLEWAVKQVEMLTRPDETILDPFLGSGTTAVAAVQTGRRFIGVEVDEGYFEKAKRRIIAAQQQLSLLSEDT